MLDRLAFGSDAVVAPNPKANWFFQVVQEVAPKDNRCDLDAAGQYFLDIGIQRSILFFVSSALGLHRSPCQFS
jgi:hypothetical protein